MVEESSKDSCACDCHLGGAISCPGCKDYHKGENCCKDCT